MLIESVFVVVAPPQAGNGSTWPNASVVPLTTSVACSPGPIVAVTLFAAGL